MEARDEATNVATLGSLNILLVEDNDDDVEIVRHVLRSFDGEAELRVAGDSIEAVALLTDRDVSGSDQPDLVLLDLNQPQGDALDVIRYVRSHAVLDDVPVVVLSGTPDQELVQEARSLGAARCLQKPMGREHLDFISSLLAGPPAAVAHCPLAKPA